jgi:pyruvate,water dikinase
VITIEVPKPSVTSSRSTDEEVMELARYAMIIEEALRSSDGHRMGQGRHRRQALHPAGPPGNREVASSAGKVEKFKLKQFSKVIAPAAPSARRSAPARSASSRTRRNGSGQAGDVLVTDMTDPNWEPVMKRASAIVTNRGGRTCHAAIIARELGIPAIVGCGDATETLTEGEEVTVSCTEGDTGHVYRGKLDFEITSRDITGTLPEIPVKIMMNVGNPELAFDFAQLPNAGVGLARVEFIINNVIGIHPKAILDVDRLPASKREEIKRRARGYATPKEFFVEKLVEGVATIAAAFWPNPVIVRLSDFKSNEYRKLLGGELYEPEEENPMLGFRGASRYIAQASATASRWNAAP